MERGVGRRKLVISKLKDSNLSGQSFSSSEIRHIRNPKNDPGNAAWTRSWFFLRDLSQHCRSGALDEDAAGTFQYRLSFYSSLCARPGGWAFCE